MHIYTFTKLSLHPQLTQTRYVCNSCVSPKRRIYSKCDITDGSAIEVDCAALFFNNCYILTYKYIIIITSTVSRLSFFFL